MLHIQHVSKNFFGEDTAFEKHNQTYKVSYSMIYYVKPELICKEEGQNLAFEQQQWNSLKTILWFEVFEFSIV